METSPIFEKSGMVFVLGALLFAYFLSLLNYGFGWDAASKVIQSKIEKPAAVAAVVGDVLAQSN